MQERLISLEHGSGGALSRELIEQVIHPCFRSDHYPGLTDAAAFLLAGEGRITTDTFVVDPPFFPGGNIGRLAIFGTCNDLSVSGARPRYLTLALVIEEGLPLALLRRALEEAAQAAAQAGVYVISGDTKVVPAGSGGGLFVNTTGVGELQFPPGIDTARIERGDRVMVSAPVGAHGLAVLAAREGLSVGDSVRSDCALLHPLCERLYSLGPALRFLRDATRGGLAAVLNEIAADAGLGLLVSEEKVPVDGTVQTAADILGLDPLEIANEGVLVAVVSRESASEALDLLRGHELGRRGAVVGEMTEDPAGRVLLETRIGGRRILPLPRGLLLPRIC
ncbi:MAG: hydrogenase expression/formation protein HypE [Spirochaetales bacterium]|nr:hydrogenase expression/formation protein HypE [Spirochaetales bacterium]